MLYRPAVDNVACAVIAAILQLKLSMFLVKCHYALSLGKFQRTFLGIDVRLLSGTEFFILKEQNSNSFVKSSLTKLLDTRILSVEFYW